MKKLLAMLLVVAFGTSLSACNTVKGFGKDVERGGEKIQGK
ncbi:entericidin A/B family lipoprotein [Oxalicibacterium faecigallinarum]|uniref:Entericidin A/B family lipoprotein n=1 Tax=Oxalicibacterium faecigallinarum TaxID=573741 RepID=A0A8J3AR34_9BURK|nr:entericidin A/B family lipoprotein [Oxalicibacterium faecigallinarum]GGI18164.1 hypothetical protein GCM10008066_12630 [Oxalicibacterium faecigallinarum]